MNLGLNILKNHILRRLQKYPPRIILSGIEVLKSLKINGFPLRSSAGMTRKRVLQEALLIYFLCLLPTVSIYAQETGGILQTGLRKQAEGKSVDDICKENNLSSEQCQTLRNELSKTGGQLTPEAIETLKKSPEFKDMKPEEISKGKELLEKKEIEEKGEKKQV